MKTKTAKTSKVYSYVIEGKWWGAWERETEEETYRAALERLKEYQDNQPEVCHRIVRKKRVIVLCECSDPGCPAHAGSQSCANPANVILYRVDMEDQTGTRFCDECANDAFESGLFTDERGED